MIKDIEEFNSEYTDWDSIYHTVYDSKYYSVYHSVYGSVWDSLWRSIGNPVWSSLGNSTDTVEISSVWNSDINTNNRYIIKETNK